MERTTPVRVILRAVSKSGRLERPFFFGVILCGDPKKNPATLGFPGGNDTQRSRTTRDSGRSNTSVNQANDLPFLRD